MVDSGSRARMEVATPSKISLDNLLARHNITRIKSIGQGSYSNVYLARSEVLDNDVAVKVIDTTRQTDYVVRFLPRELDLMKRLTHHNIIQLLFISRSKYITCVVTEFCENGDLLNRIKSVKRICEDDSKFFFRQLVEALAYLKSIKVVHRDLKCENILLDKHDNIRLADFGFARFLYDHETSNTFCGSRAYVAPEVLRANTYSGHATDIWSSGIVLYIMTTGVMPYNDKDVQRMVARQMAHKIRFPRVPLSVELKCLIFDILHPQPSRRPTYQEMCESDWLKDTEYTFRSASDCATADDISQQEETTEAN